MRGQPPLPSPPPAPARGAEGSDSPCQPISLTKLSLPPLHARLQFILAANYVTNQSEFRMDSARKSQNRWSLICCMAEPVTIQYTVLDPSNMWIVAGHFARGFKGNTKSTKDFNAADFLKDD